jgi:hypothetical protein
MTKIYPHQMFQADFLTMLQEVQRQPNISPYHDDDAEIGKELFFFFAEEILPLILSNDWVYEAAKRFSSEFAKEYFIMLRLLGSVQENQERLTELRDEVTKFLKSLMTKELAPTSINLTKPSDFMKVILLDKLSRSQKREADSLYAEVKDLEYVYVNVASQAMQAMYEKGVSRIFYVVKRGMKIQLDLQPTSSDDELQETHQYINWCNQQLTKNHIISRFLVSQRTFYKTVRNVDSHVSGPKWLPETDQVILPDRNNSINIDITEFSKRYRYLMYFCEVGVRGILATFCSKERGEISNFVKDQYMRVYNNPELSESLCDYSPA